MGSSCIKWPFDLSGKFFDQNDKVKTEDEFLCDCCTSSSANRKDSKRGL